MTQTPTLTWSNHPNRLVRTQDRDAAARSVLREALRRGDLLIRALASPPQEAAPVGVVDEFSVDCSLPLGDPEAATTPRGRVSFAGLDERQRAAFFQWSQQPTEPGPDAFRTLYLSHLETWMFEGKNGQTRCAQELARLAFSPAWHGNSDLARLTLLHAWLSQDGKALHWALIQPSLPPDLFGIGLSWLALLGRPLTPALVRQGWRLWHLPADPAGLGDEALALHCGTLAQSLGADPLAVGLGRWLDGQQAAEIPAPAGTPVEEAAPVSPEEPAPPPPSLADRFWAEPSIWQPWRTLHPHLRVRLPQANLRPALEPILWQMAQDLESIQAQGAPLRRRADAPSAADAADSAPPGMTDWVLVLEFSESRSVYYETTLQKAQRMPEYTLLMDETRKLIHRMTFRSPHRLHRFWRIWEYVQSWSDTKVYVRGKELAAWQVWPYSPYMFDRVR